MADPIVFPSATTNLSLPLLFAGQAQKEPFINHALSLVDSLLPGVVVDSLSSPPSSSSEGASYRILGNASGEWNGHDDDIAIWIGQAWEFHSPSNGMAIFDQTAHNQLRFSGGWQTATEPAMPAGGTTIDTEARETIVALIEALKAAGIFSNVTS